MQNILIITEEMASPFAHPLLVQIPLETLAWKVNVFKDNLCLKQWAISV